MLPETQARIEALVKGNKIMVFMKGTKLMPQCGFSNNVVQILNAVGAVWKSGKGSKNTAIGRPFPRSISTENLLAVQTS